jgi:hypothetical protein
MEGKTNLDKEACRLLAEILHKDSLQLFKGQDVKKIAERIPEFINLSDMHNTKNKTLSRTFGSLGITLYDLNQAQKEYGRDLEIAKKIELTMGDYVYCLLKSGEIKEKNLGYLIMGHKIKAKAN